MIVYLYSLMVDTVCMGVGITSKELFHQLLAELKKWAYEGKVPGIKLQHVPMTNYISSITYSVGKRQIGRVEVGCTKSSTYYVRVIQQPGQATYEQLCAFREQLDFFMPFLAYEKLYKSAPITRIDLAADITGHHYRELIPHRPKVHKSELWSSSTKVGGIYLGGKNSKLRFCIYDRKKKMARKLGEIVKHKNLTRIEARVRGTGLTAEALTYAMPNPFESLQIALLKKAQKIDPHLLWWQKFLEQAVLHGSAAALSGLSDKLKTDARMRLTQAKAHWWNPSALWAGRDKSLGMLVPNWD